MKALDRKLLRDLWRFKGQGLTIAVVVACGIASFVASLTTYRSLLASRDAYYASSRFADAFDLVQRAPLGALAAVRKVEGVTQAEGRVSVEAPVELPGVVQPIRGKFTSVDLDRPQDIDVLFLRSGRLPTRGSAAEVVVGESFARAWHLRPGATLSAVFQGRRASLRVVGIGLSPEYVWVIPPGAILPDDSGYGVFWMDRGALAAAVGMQGAFNDLAVKLSPGASPPRAVGAIDRILEPYGSYGAYGRDRQYSNRILNQELAQLGSSATLLPLIILGVAAFLLNVLLSRTVATQREQIAALKALGYGRGRIGWHYCELALAVVGIGAALGAGLGAWAGRGFIQLYTRYLRFPVLGYRLDLGSLAFGVAISAAAGLLGALGSVRRAVRLPAAEAMRPEAPGQFGPTLLERLGLHRLLPLGARMVVRDLERQPLRTLLSALAIAFAAGILVAGNLSFDSVDYLMEVQWDRGDRADLTVVFRRPLEDGARRTLAHLPGVARAERVRDVAVRLRAGPRSRETVLTGVDPEWTLRQILDRHARPVVLPEGGLSLSTPLGDRLGVRPGDPVELELLEGARPRMTLPVGTLVDDLLGMTAYLPMDRLDRLLSGPPVDSGAMLAVEPRDRPAVVARLQALPEVREVASRERLRAAFESQIASFFLAYQAVLALFAGAIAVGVVYNNARIALAVRAHALATLRILGFTRGEVSSILIGEQAVQLVLGLAAGLPLGRLIGEAMFRNMDPELYRLPVVISGRTQAIAVTVVLAAGAASIGWVRRQADRLDLVGVLKARD